MSRACGDVCKAYARFFLRDIDAGDVVVFIILQHTAFDHSAGCHHTDDIPLDEAFRQSGVLHLFTDGDLITFGNEPCHIVFIGMERHTAHGRTLLLAAVPARQGELQLL